MNTNTKEENFILFKKELSEIIDEKFIESWLQRPNIKFNERKPIDLVNENNFDALFAMIYIYILKSGQPS